MPVIEVSCLHKRYGSQVAVENVSFCVEQGEIFGIIGRNGSGKTTTVECIEGLRKPDTGQVSVLGLDPWQDRSQLRQRVGVQLQESELPEKLKVWEVLHLYSAFYRHPANWEQLISDLGLGEKRQAAFGKLSGGQKQRLSIALALVGNPELVILDELTTGLDPQGRRDIWQLIESIRDRGVTVLLVTHFMDEAERLCNRLAVIDQGKVVAVDTPTGLIRSASTEQRIRVCAPDFSDDQMLTDLPQVSSVRRNHDELLVTGTGDLLPTLTSAFARCQVTPLYIRQEAVTLEDAFVGLTRAYHEAGPADRDHT